MRGARIVAMSSALSLASVLAMQERLVTPTVNAQNAQITSLAGTATKLAIQLVRHATNAGTLLVLMTALLVQPTSQRFSKVPHVSALREPRVTKTASVSAMNLLIQTRRPSSSCDPENSAVQFAVMVPARCSETRNLLA